jgi:hypothetical protein
VRVKFSGQPNQRLERTRHEPASLLSDVGEPLKRNVRRLHDDHETSQVDSYYWKRVALHSVPTIAGNVDRPWVDRK